MASAGPSLPAMLVIGKLYERDAGHHADRGAVLDAADDAAGRERGGRHDRGRQRDVEVLQRAWA